MDISNKNHTMMPYGFYFMQGGLMEITVHTRQKEYPISLERGILSKVKDYVRKDANVFIVSDDGVPEKWKNILLQQFPDAPIHVFAQGEGSKNAEVWLGILKDMKQHHLVRKDIVLALGGGVVGDMAGFAAACYMRGISYINIPTTYLSQIDSSIGGKTAIDLDGAKNCIGAFWQPDAVLIDPDVLTTLSPRQYHNGLAEAVKEGLTFDGELFEIFEHDDYAQHEEEILEHCLNIKKGVVERDERETGERKLLNFGHTYGHAYETYYGLQGYLHGECVGMGMMSILNSPELKQRLEKVLIRLQLPVSCDADKDKVLQLIKNDKKANHDSVTIVQVDEIGKGYLENWSFEKLREKLDHA